jgi:hypothetical protein
LNLASIPAASDIPAKSAPTLIVFAAKRAAAKMTRTHLGNFCFNVAAKPVPVTIPIRAHMNCTQPISVQVINAVHSNEMPVCAPAIE